MQLFPSIQDNSSTSPSLPIAPEQPLLPYPSIPVTGFIPPRLTKTRVITALATEKPSQLFLFVSRTHVQAWHSLTHQNNSIIISRSLYIVKRAQRVLFPSMSHILKHDLKLNIWGKKIFVTNSCLEVNKYFPLKMTFLWFNRILE